MTRRLYATVGPYGRWEGEVGIEVRDAPEGGGEIVVQLDVLKVGTRPEGQLSYGASAQLAAEEIAGIINAWRPGVPCRAYGGCLDCDADQGEAHRPNCTREVNR